jgi:hypothetical protein
MTKNCLSPDCDERRARSSRFCTSHNERFAHVRAALANESKGGRQKAIRGTSGRPLAPVTVRYVEPTATAKKRGRGPAPAIGESMPLNERAACLARCVWQGSAPQGLAEIAAKLTTSERTVSRAARIAIERGWIKKTTGGFGRGESKPPPVEQSATLGI